MHPYHHGPSDVSCAKICTETKGGKNEHTFFIIIIIIQTEFVSFMILFSSPIKTAAINIIRHSRVSIQAKANACGDSSIDLV
jgi:hypothetical protein